MRRFLQAQQWTQPPAAVQPAFAFTFPIDGIPPDFAVEAFVIEIDGVLNRTGVVVPGFEVVQPEMLSQMVQSVQYTAQEQNGISIPNLSGTQCELLFRGRTGRRNNKALGSLETRIQHDVIVPITPQLAPAQARAFRVFGSALNGTTMVVTMNLQPFNIGPGTGDIDGINAAIRLSVLGQTSQVGLTYSPLTITTISDIPGTTYSVSDQFLSAWYLDCGLADAAGNVNSTSARTDFGNLTLTTGVTDASGTPTGNRQTVYNQLTARQIDESDAKHGLKGPNCANAVLDPLGNILYNEPLLGGNTALQEIATVAAGVQQVTPNGAASGPGVIPGGSYFTSIFDARSSRRSSPPYDVQFANKTPAVPYAMTLIGYRP